MNIDAQQLALIAAIVMGLVEAVKRGLNTPCQLSPLLSLAFGVALSVSYAAVEPHAARDIVDSVVQGLIAGLTASGLFSHARTYIPQLGSGQTN